MSATVSAQPLPTVEVLGSTEAEPSKKLQRHGSDIPSSLSSEKAAGAEIEVSLEDIEDPKEMSPLRRWAAVFVISSAALCVTAASSMASFTISDGLEPDYHINYEAGISSVSLYAGGLAIGPLFLGPLSEFFGRNGIYTASHTAFLLLNFPVAFANNAPVHLIFRFLTGFVGSAFLSVGGASMGDMFPNETVANPMAIYTVSPLIGPVFGTSISGFINQHLDWRWTYYILIIWCVFELALLVLFVPETYVPYLLTMKARRLRRDTGDTRYFAPLEKSSHKILRTIQISCVKPFSMMLYEPMLLLVDIWQVHSWMALILGIVYLTFAVFPVIFGGVYHFNVQMTGLSFLGIGIGMIFATASQPVWNAINRRETKKYNGMPPPEVRLYPGMVGGLLIPLGLFWFAFTIYPSVHWIVPIVGSAPFGTGFILCASTVFTFIVSTYREHSASGMASNAFLRSMFCVAFPLIARPMFKRLGNVGAMALLAGLTLCMAPLPYVSFFMAAFSHSHPKSRIV
ncbi:hypothetical protein BOTBODRAFT_110868 [Botryobasidium botryosum FD-172 SS1]|uniref:Major facilitator superfamily (MFS) profile domain-containing protein n=1 Tax=Botryobasidium botryosum (strain FD-172 SS1) TaxID=930990 RepID=A0A067MDW8_BOTB1|nr:hypothetical protein BOTBODRAFT_110868 [Botryobasidium botryosum FD-172 SS1]